MTWLRERPHVTRAPCALPDKHTVAPFAVWLCDVCGRRWVLRWDGDPWTAPGWWAPRLLPWPRRPLPQHCYGAHEIIPVEAVHG